MTAASSAPPEPPHSDEPPSAEPPQETGAPEAHTGGHLGAHLREFLSYAGYWLRAEVDAARAELSAAVAAAVARLAAMVALIATAVVLVLTGAAGGLGEWLGGRRWLGDLIVGAVALAFALIAIRRSRRAEHQSTEQKYADMRAQQRRDFGRDVKERARNASR